MRFTGNYGIELKLTKAQASQGHHSGQCDDDVKALSEVPAIARQLRKIDPARLRMELQQYGAWDAAELADHAQNLQRILWLACADITEQPHQ